MPSARSGDGRARAEPILLIKENIIPTSQNVRRRLVHVIGQLARSGVPAEDCARLEVVLAEVLNNIVEHAYRCRMPGALTFTISRDEDCVRVTMEDDGAPMPGGILPTGAPKDVTVDRGELPEGGFGWFLIRTLTQELSYARVGDKNQLSFSLAISEAR